MSALEDIARNGDAVQELKFEAWYMDDSTEDQRLPHRLTPDKPVSFDVLREMGVIGWNVPADSYETNEKYLAIRKVRGYSYQDLITISPTLLPNYEEKIKMFYEEHIHTDEEIRYIVDGSGYFDVRDKEDRWIRIATRKSDMIIIPAGLYHRFTLDENNYIKAHRLFVGEPVWTPYNRKDIPTDHPSVVGYKKLVGASA